MAHSNFKEDTIVAIATPPGIGAISVIRLSGPESINAVDKIFSEKGILKKAKSHTIHYGRMIEGKEFIDDVLISIFIAPHSYTGEECVEISSHGNQLIVQKIISVLVKNSGIRMAEPGEFTKRAFLNGKMDLAQAEAVAELIKSSTDISLKGARNQLNGLLSSRVKQIRQNLIDITGYIELELDFADEQIEFVDRTKLTSRIDDLNNEIQVLLNSYSFGRIVRNGLNIAIVGAPNVGKSSIMNYILKDSRSIVSSIPGTTRDIIREEISISGFLCKLFDTAGIRYSQDEVEQEGINRSKIAIKEADLIFFVGDVDSGFSKDIEIAIRELNNSSKTIKLLNKIDLNYHSYIESDFRVSAATGFGMSMLLDGIKSACFYENTYTEKDIIVTDIRHFSCLSAALESLITAIDSIKKGNSGELFSSDLRAAEFSLSEIIGEITPEDVLNNIFSKFCIGK